MSLAPRCTFAKARKRDIQEEGKGNSHFWVISTYFGNGFRLPLALLHSLLYALAGALASCPAPAYYQRLAPIFFSSLAVTYFPVTAMTRQRELPALGLQQLATLNSA
jgi:hypothetical protein